MGVPRDNALGSPGMRNRTGWECCGHFITIKGEPGVFCVKPRDKIDATEAEQKKQKNWDSSDIELLIQDC
jgi:hypothetical protein